MYYLTEGLINKYAETFFKNLYFSSPLFFLSFKILL